MMTSRWRRIAAAAGMFAGAASAVASPAAAAPGGSSSSPSPEQVQVMHQNLDSNQDWLNRAAATCSTASPKLLAAMITVESNWSASSAGGYSNLQPALWARYGQDDDGNGVASQSDVGDAVMATARHLCDMRDQMVAAIEAGSLSSVWPPLNVALAAVYAGPRSVIEHNGYFVGGGDDVEAYVNSVQRLAAQ